MNIRVCQTPNGMDVETAQSSGEVSHRLRHVSQSIEVQKVLLAPGSLSTVVIPKVAALLSSDPFLAVKTL